LRRTIDGELDKLVVLRVAAGPDDTYDRDSFGNTVEQAQELLAFLDRRIGIELLTGENIGQLDDRVIGGKQLGLGYGSANSLPRDGAGEKQPADERVCINDDPLPSLRSPSPSGRRLEFRVGTRRIGFDC